MKVPRLEPVAPRVLWRESDGVALVSDTVYLTSMMGRPTAAHVPLAELEAAAR